MKGSGLELCPDHVSFCTGIRSSKYKCLINVQLLTFITKSSNKLHNSLFVARSSNSLEIDNFLKSILFNFFLEIQTMLEKYLGTIKNLHDFISNHKNYCHPIPQSLLKNLADNTSGSFVNTISNIEMREWE